MQSSFPDFETAQAALSDPETAQALIAAGKTHIEVNSTNTNTNTNVQEGGGKSRGKTRIKIICSKCGGFREPDSYYLSYCKACGKKIQRDRYRDARLAQGKPVRERVDDDPLPADYAREDRNSYVRSLPRTGTCFCCKGQNLDVNPISRLRRVPNSEYDSMTADSTLQAWRPEGDKLMVAMVCRECKDALKVLTLVPNLLTCVEFLMNEILTEPE